MLLMPEDLQGNAPHRDLLPLVNRYQAAWNEHGVRIAQRQGVMQMYLTVAGVIYGYWFTSKGKPEIDMFLAISITLLTVCSSALVWMHHRVLQHRTPPKKHPPRTIPVGHRW